MPRIHKMQNMGNETQTSSGPIWTLSSCFAGRTGCWIGWASVVALSMRSLLKMMGEGAKPDIDRTDLALCMREFPNRRGVDRRLALVNLIKRNPQTSLGSEGNKPPCLINPRADCTRLVLGYR